MRPSGFGLPAKSSRDRGLPSRFPHHTDAKSHISDYQHGRRMTARLNMGIGPSTDGKIIFPDIPHMPVSEGRAPDSPTEKARLSASRVRPCGSEATAPTLTRCMRGTPRVLTDERG